MTGSVVGVFVERVVISDGLAEVVTGIVEIVVEVASGVLVTDSVVDIVDDGVVISDGLAEVFTGRVEVGIVVVSKA